MDGVAHIQRMGRRPWMGISRADLGSWLVSGEGIDGLFCGARRTGHDSYCERHRHEAYRCEAFRSGLHITKYTAASFRLRPRITKHLPEPPSRGRS